MLFVRRSNSGSRRALFLAGASLIAMAVNSGASARPFGYTSMSTAATAAATSAAQDAAQQAQQAALNAQQSMARATRAIQALQAAQSAARALAAGTPSSVPNGLNVGGLVPDSGLSAPGVATPVSTWVGANTPTQTTSGGQTTVNINQTQQNAVLNWQTFNVGAGTTVNFNQQGNASWSALNRIASTGVPSQIQGAIRADGRVYLINQNGIIFGGTSQVNVNTLIASTLNLGISDQAFLQSGLFSSPVPSVKDLAGNPITGSHAAIFTQTGGPTDAKIIVQSGAVIDTTGKITSAGDGGFVALLGSGGVSNAGSIITQNGQIILAANNTPANSPATNSITLITPAAGLVGTKTAMQVLAGGGLVTNEAGGLLISNDGAVTLSGGAINQLGAIVATTSTTRTGSILLSTACLNNACATANGNIVLGSSSLTAILPDESSGTLPTSTANSKTSVNGANNAPYFQTVLQPTITIQASGSVDVQGSAGGSDGALIKAPSAALTISAGINAATAGTAGTVLLEQGSTIDLSGIAGVTLPMSINQVTFKVTAAEVADTPLADGLIGQTVTIDTRLSGTRADGFHWVGSPILDAAGYVGLIPQSIDQILTAGGTFTTSAGNVIQQPGSVINVSAGYVQYTGGIITTTRVLGANGRVYDIGSADPTISYLAIATGFTVLHKVNGTVDPSLTQVYLSPLGGRGGHYEPGYISGANAGAINVTAIAPILAGDIVADVVAGNRQRAGLDPMPTGASLNVTFANPSAGTFNPYNVVLGPQADVGPDPFGLSGFSFANASTWTPTLVNGVFPVFSDVLSNASLNSVSIKGAHELSMPADAVLVVRPGGSITLDGVTTIDGVLSAPGGKISLTGFTYPVNKPGRPPTPAVVIGPDAVLDVHGLWVNDTGLLPDQMQGSAFVNGGSVSITTLAASDGPTGTSESGVFTDVTQSIVLSSGSIVDVSGGGYVDTTGKLKVGSDGLPVGKGGSVALVTYDAGPVRAGPGEGSNPYNVYPTSGGRLANVVLGGAIYAQGFDGGGTFTLTAATITIDSAATQVTYPAETPGEIILPSSFFIGGFSQYTLSDTYGGTTITAGTQVVLQQTNALPTGNVAQIPTGTLVSSFASVGLLPDGLRQPVGLTLNGTNILLDGGAAIVADPQATVSLVAGNTATVLGSIVAQGGAINVSGTGVRIGSTAVLDVSGTFVPNPLVTAYSTGTVLGGGTITLTALGGNLVAEPGAQFDLQGAAVTAQSNLIQLPQGGLAPQFVGQAAWSNGGNLQLFGKNIYFAGAVDAAGGAPLASGGSLTIGSIIDTVALPRPTTIVVEQGGFVAANLPALTAASTPGAFIGADTLSNSGFDSVTLNAGTITFGGSLDVKIPGALTLYASSGHFSLADATTVNLNAGYVRVVGLGLAQGGLTAPAVGAGTLNVTAQWIDLQRAIALDNVGYADFSSAGAIRLLPDTYGFTSSNVDGRTTFAGALVVPGNLTLRAAEIYPVSNTDFLVMSTGALPSTGTITIAQNGVPTAPLSAGGSIVLSAQTIVQGGTLWAPLGSIVLGVRDANDIPAQFTGAVAPLFSFAPGLFTPTQSVTLGEGSLTSVSAAGLVIPDGLTVDGTTWYQGSPLTGNLPAVLSAPPSKSISLFGANVATQPGAKLDLSGGGDIYATEYVAGTGGTRNVLATYQQDPTTGALTPTYADGRQVYALVPSYEAKVAAYDPNFAYAPYSSGVVVPTGSSASSTQPYANALTPGQSVTIAAGSGIPAGTYTLLPGMYATLPGAYRVVQVAGNVKPATPGFTSPDGSQYVTGTLGNALTGTQSSQPALFQLQSKAVWSTYSRIDITSGTSFFRNQAIAAGKVPPPLPIDGGVLVLGAINSLNLAGTNLFGPGTSDLAPGLVGGGGQVQIGGANILVLASDKTVPAGDCLAGSAAGCTGAVNYLVLDADQISGLGASSVLIGGTAAVVNGVENITATALNLEILTDNAHKLTGPELLLVSLGGSGRGVVVDAGSVIQAVGAVPSGTDRDIIFGANPVAQVDPGTGKVTGYTAGITGDGALLRVSNGTVVNVTRFFVPGQYTGPGPLPSSPTPQGAFSVGAGASIDGGNALTLDTSGSGALASNAVLNARNYDIAGSVINVGGGASGVVLSTQVLGNFNDAVSVRLRSASVINLYDVNGLQIGDAAHPIGTLTFDSAGLYNAGLDSAGHYVQGGSTTVYATNIDLANSRGVTGTGIGGAGGTLTLNASGTITEDVGVKRLAGFSAVNFNAGQAIAFSGAGSLDSGPVATATASLGVAGIAVTSGGSGYSNGDQVTVSGSDGNGNTVVATGTAIVDAGGAIIGVNITAAGSGFAGPVASVAVSSASGGSGATLAASLGVVGVSLANAGDGYTGSPTLAFTGGGGTGATAVASVSGGVVSGLTLANGGSGYTSVPTVLISGGGGGAANMLLSAPVVLVNRGATQSLATGGSVTLVTGAGTAPAGVATNIGGALTVTAASIADTATIRALSGNVSLTATAGDVMLGTGAVIDASGSRITIGDVFQDAPGGNVQLTSTTGNVTIGAGAAVSVAGAGIGYAGSLSILAAKNATLDGALDGHAAFKDTGGRFTLQAGSESGALPLSSGFTGGFAVQLGRGDIAIGAGQILASGNVLLVASNGSVIVDGTIDASGPGGGQIALYGACLVANCVTAGDVPTGGVFIHGGALLNASYVADDPHDPLYGNGTSTLVQTGGTITLGTSGNPDGTLNTAYGYQNVPTSGAITVAAGAVLDVSGGPGGPNIANSGGSVIIRAPILTTNDPATNNTVKVDFRGTVRGVTDAGGNATGKGVVLNAYAVWSTTDTSTGAQHFDGIVDPAGWYGPDGNLVAGTFTDPQGHTIAYTPGDGTTAAQLKTLLTNDIFTPAAGATNVDHTGFYGYVDPNTGNAAGTLPLFVQTFSLANTPISGSIANVHLRPEIDLINPSSTVNNGNITVASNWNLGAGSSDSSGNVTLYYRTASGGEPGTLALRAVNNVNINATISDGFFLQYRATPLPVVVPAKPGSMPPTATYWYDQELAALAGYAGTDHDYNHYIDANGNLTFGGPTFDQMFGNGSYIPYSLLGPVKLQAPMVFSNPQNDLTTAKLIDQYIQYYYQYTQLFDVYAKSTAFNEGFYGPPPSGQSPYLPPAAPTTPDNYYNFLTGAQPGSGTDYVSQYQNYYLQVLVNVNAGSAAGGFATAYKSANCGPCVANAAPFAPMEVLASSVQPGYSPSAPVVTTIPAHLAGPVTADMIATVYAQAMDAISNNPLVPTVLNFDPLDGIGNIMNATSATPLMTAAVSGKGSFSYNFVAGAAFTNNTLSVDPNAVVPVSSLSPTVTGNVTIDGHTSYPDVLPAKNQSLTINIPTLVRTGTGSITIAAAGNVEFLDQVTPGAIYTAGAAVAATPPNFNAPTLPAKYTATPNGLVSTPAWATGGGAVTVTAGGSIIGIEMPTDSDGSQTGIAGATTGQMWSDWYIHYGKSNGLVDGKTAPFSDCAAAGSVACQTAAWINYATFFQAFGALGGGNITLKAGADIIDVGASLPETLVVSGGFTAADPPKATYYGGGNLSVIAGGNLLSSDFLVGRGTGLIQVGGVVQATTSNPLNQGKPTVEVNPSDLSTHPLPLLLAVQDGFITLAARGSVTLGNVYDPASLPLNAGVQTDFTALPGASATGQSNPMWSNLFTTYGPGSGVSLASITGDITAVTIAPPSVTGLTGLFVHNPSPKLGSATVTSSIVGLLLPATLDLTAFSGDITINKTGASDFGNASLVPYPTQTGSDTGTISLVAAGSINLGLGLAMPDLLTTTAQYIGGNALYNNYISPLGVPLANLTVALHANDPVPVIIAAGQDIYAVDPDTNLVASLTLIKPARIEAGNNIYAAIALGGGLATTGSGPQSASFTFIGQNNNAGDITSIVAGNDLVGGSYALYGPGTFVLQAGHDLGPFASSGGSTQGIATVGNGSALGNAFIASDVKPYLPAQGAEIDLLFGVKPGINYAAAITQYVDPAHAGTGGIDFLADIASILGQPRDQAWATFQGLSSARQQLLVDRAFLDLLIQVGKDYKNPASPYFAQYARAYTAISTLFPPGSGYTDNTTGSGNGAAAKIATGRLNIAASVLETQMGGDINILGPGGGITVGHTSLDTLTPNQEGILTLGGGTIRAFSDDSILVNQSRIMTQQGGDIGLFVANGDINAGSGPKTYASSPSVSEICTVDGYCYTNPQGLVTGAGIAALVTLPGQDPTKSNVTLIAPRGTIDVSAAGIRGNDITLVALQVLNAFNITATGAVTGLAFTPPPNVALATTTNVTAATQQSGQPAPAKANDQPSIIIVEVVGYGGSGDDTGAGDDDDRRRRVQGQ